jgi:hypothetical protein
LFDEAATGHRVARCSKNCIYRYDLECAILELNKKVKIKGNVKWRTGKKRKRGQNKRERKGERARFMFLRVGKGSMRVENWADALRWPASTWKQRSRGPNR